MEREKGGKGEREKGSEGTLPRSPAPLHPCTPAVRGLWSVVPILLIAFGLRVWNLTGIPPGLTHDEANHGREAIEVLAGVFRFFFPLNYGSEPLYSYAVAGFMALLGRGVFALRLVNVVFGTAAVAVTYAWAAPRLGRGAALLGAALLAVSFWPLAASREALRAGMLPFFVGLAVVGFWRLLAVATEEREKGRKGERGTEHAPFLPFSLSPLIPINRAVVLFGIAVALTVYIYLAARVSWLLFPAFLGYLALAHREAFRRAWRPVAVGLLLAGLLVAPLFLYLRAHPEMQTRLDMLDRPLQGLAAGEVGPLLLNVRDALLAFVWPGFGDQFVAYNIPGRPVLDMASAVFFVLGVLVCVWRRRRPAYAFLLLWFLFGILPSLVTGPTANTTRNLAALPAVYLIISVGFVVPLQGVIRRTTNDERRTTNAERSSLVSRYSPLATLLVVSFFLWVAFISARDYFVRWADSAKVRGAYQHTLVESIRHLQTSYPDADPILFSTVYPGPAHDASIALALAADRPAIGRVARWVDARYAMTLPPARTLAVIPHSTLPHPAFIPYLEAIETIDIRPDDLDPRFTLYWIDSPATAVALAAGGELAQPVDFNGAVELIAARWLSEATRPGETAELLTVWRVLDPTRAGPVAPPTFTTDVVTFAHVLDSPGLDGTGGILTQSDRLDSPSWAWQTGDVVAQIHPLAVPASAAPGEYAVVVGIYDRATGARLPVADGGDTAAAPPLIVAP